MVQMIFVFRISNDDYAALYAGGNNARRDTPPELEGPTPPEHPMDRTDPTLPPAGSGQGDPVAMVLLIFCYLGVLALIPFILRPDDAFLRWHAKQGLTLAAALILGGLVMGFVPLIGWILTPLLGLVGLGAAVFAALKGLSGERWPIPVVSDFASKW